MIYDLCKFLTLLLSVSSGPIFIFKDAKFYTPLQFFAEFGDDYGDIPEDKQCPFPWNEVAAKARSLGGEEKAVLVQESRDFTEKVQSAVCGPEQNGHENDVFVWSGPYGPYVQYSKSAFMAYHAQHPSMLLIINAD